MHVMLVPYDAVIWSSFLLPDSIQEGLYSTVSLWVRWEISTAAFSVVASTAAAVGADILAVMQQSPHHHHEWLLRERKQLL